MMVAVLLATANLTAPLDRALRAVSQLGEFRCDYEIAQGNKVEASGTVWRSPAGRIRIEFSQGTARGVLISDGRRTVEFAPGEATYRSAPTPTGFSFNPEFLGFDKSYLPPLFRSPTVMQMRSASVSPPTGFQWSSRMDQGPGMPVREDALAIGPGGLPKIWQLTYTAEGFAPSAIQYRFTKWSKVAADPSRYVAEPPLGASKVPPDSSQLWFTAGDQWPPTFFSAAGVRFASKPVLLVFTQPDCIPSARLWADASWRQASTRKGYDVRQVMLSEARIRQLEAAEIEVPGTPLVTAFDKTGTVELSFFGFGTEYDREVKRMVDWFTR